MKTILVPTDFSATAGNALYFAIQLANKINARITLISAFEMPVVVTEIPFEILEEEQKVRRKEVETQLSAECERHSGVIKMNYEAFSGSAVDTILNYLKKNDVDYVIMGTNGAGKHTAGFFGSTTSQLIEKSNCPVIAIPEGAFCNNEIHKITYATDYRLSDVASINKLTEIAEAFHAHINILHISEAIVSSEEETKLMNSFKERLINRTDYVNMSFQITSSPDVAEKLVQYVSEGLTDMLVISTHYKNFMERLFTKSFAKKMALKTSIPFVAFHYHKATSIKL